MSYNKQQMQVVFDVATSDQAISADAFAMIVRRKVLTTEIALNEDMRLRWHAHDPKQVPLNVTLQQQRRHWRRMALLFAVLFVACLLVVVLQYCKLP